MYVRLWQGRLLRPALAAIAMGLGLQPVGAGADGPLVMAYFERPPLHFTACGKPAGHLVNVARRALARAGLQAHWQSLPLNRIARLVRDATVPVCSPGWHRSGEAAGFAQFSGPLDRERKAVVLARAERVPAIAAHSSLANASQDRSLLLGTVERYSHGAYLDSLTGSMAGNAASLAVTQSMLARMVAAARLDYMLVDPAEVHFLISETGIAPGSFAVLDFADVPYGPASRLMCSRAVSPATLALIDAAIAREVGNEPAVRDTVALLHANLASDEELACERADRIADQRAPR